MQPPFFLTRERVLLFTKCICRFPPSFVIIMFLKKSSEAAQIDFHRSSPFAFFPSFFLFLRPLSRNNDVNTKKAETVSPRVESESWFDVTPLSPTPDDGVLLPFGATVPWRGGCLGVGRRRRCIHYTVEEGAAPSSALPDGWRSGRKKEGKGKGK